VVSVDELARRLGVVRKTIYVGVERGEIPHARLGRRILFSKRAIEQWLAGGNSNPASR
jgi:excisionase family DNA binding protein